MHAYSRAVRGHSLVQLALTQIILSSIQLTDTDTAHLESLLLDVEKENFIQKLQTPEFIDLRKKIITQLCVLKEKGKTIEILDLVLGDDCFNERFYKSRKTWRLGFEFKVCRENDPIFPREWALLIRKISAFVPTRHASTRKFDV